MNPSPFFVSEFRATTGDLINHTKDYKDIPYINTMSGAG